MIIVTEIILEYAARGEWSHVGYMYEKRMTSFVKIEVQLFDCN
jgi:hypothetical protein